MARIGYARVSTDDQTLDLQRDALRQAGCIDIYEDTASGKRQDRPALAQVLRTCTSAGVAFRSSRGSPWTLRRPMAVLPSNSLALWRNMNAS
jgi:hypothetical protein